MENPTISHTLGVNMNINTNNQLYFGMIQSSGTDPVFLPLAETHNKVTLVAHSSNLSLAYIAGIEIKPQQMIDIKVGNLNYLYITSNSGQVNNVSFIGS